MKNQVVQHALIRKLFVSLLFLGIAITSQAQVPPVPPPSTVGCYKSTGEYVPCGNSWIDSYNGVDYLCTCPCGVWSSNFNQCNPVTSGSSNTLIGEYINPDALPGQVRPGETSIYNIYEGKPLFSTHQSAAFEDMAMEYQELIKRLGGEIKDGKLINSPVPLTGVKEFDEFYLRLYLEFNPKVAEDKQVVDDAKNKKVDPSVNQAAIDPNDLKKSDPSYSLKASAVLMPVMDNKITPTEHPVIDAGRDLVTNAIGTLVPGWVGYGLKFGTILVAEDVKALVDVYDNKPCPSTTTIISNAVEKMKEDVVEDVKGMPEDIVQGKAVSFSKFIGIKSGIKPINIYNAVKTFEWGSTAVDTFKDSYNLGIEIFKK